MLPSVHRLPRLGARRKIGGFYFAGDIFGLEEAPLSYARSIPTVGGHTEFADERAAYDGSPRR